MNWPLTKKMLDVMHQTVHTPILLHIQKKPIRHPIIGLLDCIPLEFAMPRII